MSKKIIIQDEISITQQEVDEVIKKYETKRSKMKMGMMGWSGDAEAIIKEIKKLSPVGKRILLMNYELEKWKKSEGCYELEKETEAQ